MRPEATLRHSETHAPELDARPPRARLRAVPTEEVVPATSVARASAVVHLARAPEAAIEVSDGTRLVVALTGLERAGGRLTGDVRLTCCSPGVDASVRTAAGVLLAETVRPPRLDGAVDAEPLRHQVRRLAPMTLLEPFLDRWLDAMTRWLTHVVEADEDHLGPVAETVPVDDLRVPLSARWTLAVENLRFDGALVGDAHLHDANGGSRLVASAAPLLTSDGERTAAIRRRAARALTLRLQLGAARAVPGAIDALTARLSAVRAALVSCDVPVAELP